MSATKVLGISCEVDVKSLPLKRKRAVSSITPPLGKCSHDFKSEFRRVIEPRLCDSGELTVVFCPDVTSYLEIQ